MSFNRRQFIQTAGSVAALRIAGAEQGTVSIVVDPSDSVASSGPARWATDELERSLTAAGVSVRKLDQITKVSTGDFCIVAAAASSPLALSGLKAAGATVPSVPEALGLVPTTVDGRKVLLACGYDTRGLVYAVLELADRVRNSADALLALTSASQVTERPFNKVRGVARLFTSDVEDKPWFNDREMWPLYLTSLATQRFNQFHLSFGIGYDFIRQVTDAYFLFTYPFLLSVPGFQVRVPQLPDSERDSNLQMLKFISEQTVARGMKFQLGLWMHGYEWIDSPHPNYTIEGLTAANHGPYCREAVRMLLKECPAITGVTFRVHGESGVEEGSYEFWKMVFEGVSTCGRTVDLDMHSKGMDQTMLDLAVDTKLPVRLSPKFWAEHMGMPYHQADIRVQEQPQPGKQSTGLMKFSAGSRSFLRYGYGDLLRENRPWSVIHRIWPGTQRLLLWGDPVFAAGYSRAFQFCGSDGMEICEPLSFKGRRGSGIAGDRCAYADPTLRTRWDWQKYEYSLRVWGRNLYNPDCDADVWQRSLRKSFAGSSENAGAALANASRILPVVTTAHLPSAANNSYWPEIYTNQSLVDGAHPEPFTDTPAPKVFGNTSPLDPQLFSRINDFAEEILTGERTGKISPIEVAQWIEDDANAAAKCLSKANAQIGKRADAEFRRLSIDVTILAGLGRFYGAKMRAGVLYRIFEQTGDKESLQQCLNQYRDARKAWEEIATLAKSIYVADITVGEHRWLRGHWMDRLPAIDKDIASISTKLGQANDHEPKNAAKAAIKEALGRPQRPSISCTHNPPGGFRPGESVSLQVSLKEQAVRVRCYYRHVDQAERYQSMEMKAEANIYRVSIPGEYTKSVFPLEYYFEVKLTDAAVSLFPGFNPARTNQPYFVLRQT
jgi:hypothetical protein